MLDGPRYVYLTDHEIARTVHVDELVLVDVDGDGVPVGVEFVAPPSAADCEAVFVRFPELREFRALAAEARLAARVVEVEAAIAEGRLFELVKDLPSVRDQLQEFFEE